MARSSLNDIQKMDVEKSDFMLGKGLQMPFAASNSGSRKLMFGTQLEHRLPLINPDVAFIQTGYEMEFGKYSSSFNRTDVDQTVVAIIPKFSWMPKHHYFVVVADEEQRVLHVYERKEYKHITENYGYLYDNETLDSLVPGQDIPKGTVIQRSMAFDKYDNRMDGKNMLTMYSACEETMEDAIVISESASKKLASPLVKKVNVIINDNDIPLNLYGDANTYKAFPDIGEESQNSILCALRREKKEECLYSQSYGRLRELSISDERYTVAGRVVDINVYCNAPDKLSDGDYSRQLKVYYDENIRMSKEIINALQPYLSAGYIMDYDLQVVYSAAVGALNGKQYFSERAFSNIILEITIVEEIPVLCGDKLSNRYGGKGITASVRPDALMPKTANGETIDVILNMCGVYGRENAGQLFEITVSYVSMKIIEYINLKVLDVADCIDLYLRFLRIVAPSMAKSTEELFDNLGDDECIDYISSIYGGGDKAMYLVIEPMSENMTIDKVAQLYEEFPWVKPETMLMPTMSSTGKVRYIPSRRPMIYGYQYIYRLKQYAEEKFSVTSLSATNVRNENSKSKSSNNYKALYSRTPIRFGDMETGNLIHLGAELVVQMLMLYSTSPHARRLTSEMLTGDAFDVDVKLDMESKNRNVEILNVYLKTMGLKLVFQRIPKKKEYPMLISPMLFFDNPRRLIDPFIQMAKGEYLDVDKEAKRLIDDMNGKNIWAMEVYPMEFEEVPEDGVRELPDKYKK